MSDSGAFPWTTLKHVYLFLLTVYFELFLWKDKGGYGK